MLPTPKSTIDLGHLPSHLLEMIVENYDAGNDQFEPLYHIPRDIYVSYVDRQFAEYLSACGKGTDEHSVANIRYRVYAAATHSTMRYLGISPFTAPIGVILNAHQYPPFANCLWKFYSRRNSQDGGEAFCMRRNFTVALTLMRLLHMFRLRWDTVRRAAPHRWHIAVRLQKVSLGSIGALRTVATLSDTELLVSLATLLLLEARRSKVEVCWGSARQTLLFAYTPKPSNKRPCCVMCNICLRGSRDQLDLLLKCLRHNEPASSWPADVLDENFRMQVQLTCCSNNKWTPMKQDFQVVNDLGK